MTTAQRQTRKRQRRHNNIVQPIQFGPPPIKDVLFLSKWYYESLALLFGVDPGELWPTRENEEFSFHDNK